MLLYFHALNRRAEEHADALLTVCKSQPASRVVVRERVGASCKVSGL